ncbi:MAG: type II secretion system protein GspH [Candidatus Electrothrix sp. ATG1]|nr:type II secretion system protein GspH [Candidatus Electrothrix sp. ATG1]
MEWSGCRGKGKKGFSLLELMLVISLLGILSAISIPSLLRNAPERRLRNAARNLYADLQRARLVAVKENKKVTVRFNELAGYYFIDKDAQWEEGYKVWDTDELGKRLADYGGVIYGKGTAVKNWNKSVIKRVVPYRDIITFKPAGTASSASVYLQHLHQDAVTYAVTTTTFGAVKVRTFNGSAWQ